MKLRVTYARNEEKCRDRVAGFVAAIAIAVGFSVLGPLLFFAACFAGVYLAIAIDQESYLGIDIAVIIAAVIIIVAGVYLIKLLVKRL